MKEQIAYESILNSPYSNDVKRSVWSIYHTGYIPAEGRSTLEYIEHIEDIVIENGLFIGGRCLVGDFYVMDLDDLIFALYGTIIGEYEPPKPFTRKVTELYKKSILRFY